MALFRLNAVVYLEKFYLDEEIEAETENEAKEELNRRIYNGTYDSYIEIESSDIYSIEKVG